MHTVGLTHIKRNVNICMYYPPTHTLQAQHFVLPQRWDFQLCLISISVREQADQESNKLISLLSIRDSEHIGEITRYESVALSTPEGLSFIKDRLSALAINTVFSPLT